MSGGGAPGRRAPPSCFVRSLLWCAPTMTPIWAPWRLEYIAGPKQGGCFLCSAAAEPAGFRENLVVLVQEHAFVCLNRYPFTTSHLLVAPRRHVGGLED